MNEASDDEQVLNWSKFQNKIMEHMLFKYVEVRFIIFLTAKNQIHLNNNL